MDVKSEFRKFQPASEKMVLNWQANQHLSQVCVCGGGGEGVLGGYNLTTWLNLLKLYYINKIKMAENVTMMIVAWFLQSFVT